MSDQPYAIWRNRHGEVQCCSPETRRATPGHRRALVCYTEQAKDDDADDGMEDLFRSPMQPHSMGSTRLQPTISHRACVRRQHTTKPVLPRRRSVSGRVAATFAATPVHSVKTLQQGRCPRRDNIEIVTLRRVVLRGVVLRGVVLRGVVHRSVEVVAAILRDVFVSLHMLLLELLDTAS